MAKYRKKPIVIEAFKWTGGPDQVEDPEWIVEALQMDSNGINSAWIDYSMSSSFMWIRTANGIKDINIGDYITRDENGALNKCSPSEFEASYDLVS